MDFVVNNKQEIGEGYLFGLAVEGHDFEVGMSQHYYQQLTKGKITPEELLEESFKFLLEHEPVTSILSRFELPTIQKYFPDYEQTISEV